VSYHGYVPALQHRLATLQHPPRVLEIGIDRGVTLIPLVVAMAASHESFQYVGVDVDVQESVKLIVKNLGRVVDAGTFLFQANSLDFMPKLVEQAATFDVVLLDGDHNYHTVSSELQYLDRLVAPDGIVIIDDYDGRWSTRDLWYAQRPGYEQNAMVTAPVDTEKHGVKPAVDEWLERNAGWALTKPMPGEPVVLVRKPQ
jgi:predicted O-methyltransferase YrrM